VWRDDDIGKRPERRVSGQRLVGKDIEGRAADCTRRKPATTENPEKVTQARG